MHGYSFLKSSKILPERKKVIDHNIIITIIYKFATVPFNIKMIKSTNCLHTSYNLQDESMIGETDKKAKKKVNILVKKNYIKLKLNLKYFKTM